jgi:hypothetical protein
MKKPPPQDAGAWEVLPYSSQVEAVHLALLRTGKVLYWSGFRIAEGLPTETRLWYPKTGEIKTVPTPEDIFCAGHSFLPDGRLLSTGGTLEYRNLPGPAWLVRLTQPLQPTLVPLLGPIYQRLGGKGILTTGPTFLHIFDPIKEQWEFAGDMGEGRWYPTNTTLPDGRILLLSGTDQGGGVGAKLDTKINRRVEVFDPKAGIQQVAEIPATQTRDGRYEAFPSEYPRMHVLPLSEANQQAFPDGKLFCSGYGPETKFLDPRTWQWTNVGDLHFGPRHDGCSVLLPLRPPTYQPQVLVFGGAPEDDALAARATATAEIIDLGDPQPAWRQIAPLATPRVNSSAVLLPDGTVLAVGGNRSGRFTNPALDGEVYEPKYGKWRQVAPMSVPRGYHSTALLLPDGRVLSAGSTPFGPWETRMEVYSPDYLYRGERPRIQWAPAQVSYNQEFEVAYEASRDVSAAVFLRPGANTHAFDMDQRYVELAIATNQDRRLAMKAPPDAHVAPPGYYMLFLLTDVGVPSEAKFIQLA